jgi:hypothetical protein
VIRTGPRLKPGLRCPLFLEDAVLLDEVGDDVGLVAVHQAGKRHEEDLERVALGQH